MLIRFLVPVFLAMLALPAAAGAPAQYRLGMEEYDKGDSVSIGNSVTYFKRALDINPYYFQALKGIGMAYFRLDHHSLAVEHLTRALRQKPGDPEANLYQAQALMALGRVEEAKQHIDRVLRAEPRSVLALYTDALYWLRIGRRDLALSRLAAVRNIQPSFHLVWIKLGELYAQAGKYREAESHLRQAIVNNTNSPEGYLALGKFLSERGRIAEAVLPLSTALSLDAGLLDVLQLLGRIHFKLGEWDKALDIYTRLTGRLPYSHLARYALALTTAELAATDSTKAEDAIRLFEEALVLRNNDEIIRYAFEDFAVRALPIRHPARAKLSRHHLDHAGLYVRTNQVKQALVAIRRAIRLNPVDPAARRVLAGLYRDLGLWEAFHKELQVLAMLEPGNTNLKDRLEFYRRTVDALPSRRQGMQQYESGISAPRIMVFDSYEQFNAPHGYFRVPEVFGAMFRDALTTRGRLTLIRVDDHRLSSPLAARQTALARGADYYTLGRYILGDSFTIIELDVHSSHSGVRVAHFRSSRRGNSRLFELAVDLADKLDNSLPAIARIIRLLGDQVVLDGGSRQGLRKGMLLDAVPGASFRRDYLAAFGRGTPARTTGRIRLTVVDEMVSFGEIIDRQAFDSVAGYQYVIPAPGRGTP